LITSNHCYPGRIPDNFPFRATIRRIIPKYVMSRTTFRDDSRYKVIDYIEFLSHFECELFFDNKPQISTTTPVRPLAGNHNSKSESSMNPYPNHAPYNNLDQMEKSIMGCLRCPLGSSRNKFVFGVGSSEPKVVFIGEAPGAEEDKRGIPFIGRAGKLLDHMLDTIGWSREEVYICNILKCRPPNNRDPQPEEIAICELYLHEQLRLLDPQWLVALGRVSAQVLLRSSAPLKAMRGRLHKYRDKPFWVTYHPAALLRNQNLMPDARQDLLTLKKMLEEGISGEDGTV